MESAHGIEPVVIGVMQVAAMVRGGAWAVQSGEGGLWAMIERKLPGAQARQAQRLGRSMWVQGNAGR
ncbi:hypothetical protein FIV35_05320 [Pseudomonas rhodesiae]|nr:hypothetical protein FIV35_05320 [Pseudomonas rhodesiae]